MKPTKLPVEPAVTDGQAPVSGRSAKDLWGEEYFAMVKDRSLRGTLGALIRGGMCSPVTYGYSMISPIWYGSGARWEIHEKQAVVVREIFQMRILGMSLGSIARELNARGVAAPGKPRKSFVSVWRAGTVLRILRNTIYRGVYTFKISTSFAGSTQFSVEYPRVELRLVSDEIWVAANLFKK